MWFEGVEVPPALVEAHRTGNLVLFVGAGASRDQPAGLPLFDRLTDLIAEDSARPSACVSIRRIAEAAGDNTEALEVIKEQALRLGCNISGWVT